MDSPAPESVAGPAPRRHASPLASYAVSLTVVVLGFLGWYIWQGMPSASCPMPSAVQYSYDDPRDYLRPFLSAVSSHDARLIRRYEVPGINQSDRASIDQAAERFRSMQLEVGTYGPAFATTDVGYDGTAGDSFTRLTWHTRKVDGCWRVQRVDEETLTNP